MTDSNVLYELLRKLRSLDIDISLLNAAHGLRLVMVEVRSRSEKPIGYLECGSPEKGNRRKAFANAPLSQFFHSARYSGCSAISQ
jgi:hypothetical protein